LIFSLPACDVDGPRPTAGPSEPTFREIDAPPDGNGPGAALDVDVELTCDGPDCCPAEMAVVDGTAAVDDLATGADDKCIVLRDGADTLVDSGRRTVVLGGSGADTLTVDGAAYVAADEGADTIVAIGPRTEIYGGPGPDTITTASDRHLIVPGEGADTVTTGPGSVVVQIRDACELEAGESLTASGEDDTLILPVPAASLESLGVEASGFERIIVAGASCRAACAPTNCVQEEVVL
jgi:Ca2+-binding RTX toxin-like protein